MIPLGSGFLPRVQALAQAASFAGEWAWAVGRFANAIRPDAFLFRADWRQQALTALTLYCRFPVEPHDEAFEAAIGYARPFRWQGPAPSTVATGLDVTGPRGIAFRATAEGDLRTALYFRNDSHTDLAWHDRLATLLMACQYPANLAPTITTQLKALYRPGPTGVIGIDDGEAGVASALKFDPANVLVPVALSFLAQQGVPAARLTTLRNVAHGLRVDTVSYVGVRYTPAGFAGWRVYFSCEPAAILPQPAVELRRHLRAVRRLPHH
jgi:hypothetical protein